MPQFITRLRRRRWCNLIVHEGNMLREAQQELGILNAAGGPWWDDQRERFMAEIDRRERRLEELRANLRETA